MRPGPPECRTDLQVRVLAKAASPRFHDLDYPVRLGVPHPGVSRLLFDGPGYQIAEFHLPPGHARWGRLNYAGGNLIAFPRVPVRLGAPGMPTVVANSSSAYVFRAGQKYARECVSSKGDQSDVLLVADSIADEIALPYDRAARGFSELCALPVPDASYAELRILIAEVRRVAHPDEKRVRERVFGILRNILETPVPTPEPRLGARARAAHREIVEGLKLALGQRVGVQWSLDQMALKFGVTPAHLCRIFREGTGTTIHAYRERLALRASLDPLGQGCRDITELALDLGFSSHSHFTGRFRKYFGRSPSEMRTRLTGG